MYLKNKQDKCDKRNYWVLNEFIRNPDLYKGYKYHLRIYFLVDYTKNHKGVNGYISKFQRLYHAKNTYTG